ncbi:MAG: hypothetical protein WA446_08880 [Steroidobacteraceae bacterium]
MTIDEKIESLIEQTAELPEDAQAALVQSLVKMHFQRLDIDDGYDEQF